MSGQIHRRKKKKDFVMLDTHCLRNKALKWDAKGLHSYLMQLPDDWKINISDLTNRSKDGTEGTSSPMNALIKAGYVKRIKVLGERGRFAGYDYEVFEHPLEVEDREVLESTVTGFSVHGKTVNGESVNGKPGTNKDYITNNELTNNEEKVSANADLSIKKSLEPIDEAFIPLDALSKKRKSTPGAEKEKKVEALPALDFSRFDNPEAAEQLFTRWLKYRKDIKHPYKSEDTIQTSLKNLFNYSAGRAALAEHIIEKSIGNGYQGFFKPEIQKNGNSTIQPENRFNSAETIASAQRVAESMREYWQ